jgi:hypothetical protein
VRGEKPVDIIYDRLPDPVVSAPFAVAGVDDVPERDVVQAELFNPACVGEASIDCKERLYDLPEMVSGIPVILGSQKRLPARKTAEDEDFRGIAYDRVETGTAFRDWG